ncbi:MAG: VCBS repeat-containing protein, partial [Gemmatimonadetes bacterium]|nr:VCBS repeat-containing protein [Gemmatimonadota bacterium]
MRIQPSQLVRILVLASLVVPTSASAAREPVRATDALDPADALALRRAALLPRDVSGLPASTGSPLRQPVRLRHRNVVDRRFLPADAPSLDGSAIDQVIVTSTALEAEFATFADRETRRGIPTVVRTVDWIDANYPGVDRPARTRNFLRAAHDLWGARYAVLGADADVLPPRYVEWQDIELASDLYYACLDRDWNEDGDANFGEPLGLAAFDGLVVDIAVATDGAAWSATSFGPAALAAGTFSAWADLGLASSAIVSLDVADDGTVWVASAAGVARWDGVAWTAWSANGGPLPGLQALVVEAVSHDVAWIGMNDGLVRFSSGTFERWTTSDGLPGTSVVDVARDGADVWVATPQGLARFDGSTFTSYTTADGLLSNWIETVAVAPDGVVWAGHPDNFFVSGGLSWWDGVTWTSEALPPASGRSVRDLAFGPGADDVWVATPFGLLHRTAGGDVLLGAADGLASDETYAVARDGDTIYVATAAGISVGDGTTWTTFGPAEGLPVAPHVYDDVDLRPDLVIGRVPASDPAELATYLAKVAAYEDGAASDHGDRALFLGEDLFTPGDGKAICQDLAARFPGTFSITGLYEVDGGQNAATSIAALDQGPGWVVHVGHGSYDALAVGPGLELLFNRDLDALASAGRASFFNVASCNSGAFDFESSAEHLLFNANGGAVGVLANTRDAVAATDAEMNRAFFDKMFTSAHGRPAEVFNEVRGDLLDEDVDRFRIETWWRRMLLTRTYFGVPTIASWRGAPVSLDVAHPAQIPLRRAPFLVTVSEPGSGLPVAGALVCATKDLEDYVYGTTDSTGAVTFDFRPESLGGVELTVTSPGALPYHAWMPVVPAVGPNAVAEGWQFVDPSPDSTPTEREFLLAVRNTGADATLGWTVQLTSPDTEVVVVQGTGTLSALSGGEIAWTGPFRVALGPDVSDGATFRVRLHGNGPVDFDEEFVLVASSPELEWLGLERNGDAITPVLRNVGSLATGAITATLVALDGTGTVVDGDGGGAALDPGSAATLADGFVVNGPDTARFRITITDETGHVLVRDVDRTAPAGVTELESEPRDAGVLLTWTPSESPDVQGYRVLGRRSDGGFDDVLGHLSTGASLAEVALAPGTSREFAVVPIDVSGHASADTARVVAFAAPATLPGWPRQITSLVGPSPVIVSNLDGLGASEVILGSMWEAGAVHAFRADGTEWLDGDSNPATDGLFGATGERIHAAPLAVDVDGDGHQEIFAASLDGSVYAWRTNETAPGGEPMPLPGWPVFHTNRGVRSAPVAADLDGDLSLEIVTFANDGIARAFEADGTPVAGWPRPTGQPGTGSTPAVWDLDGDGRDDVVFGATDSLLYAISGTGVDLPGFPVALTAKMVSSPVLADVDADGELEIFAMVRDGRVFGLRSDGTSLPGWPVSLEAYGFTPPSPAVADLDGD